jgi:hypothetical protein
VRIIRYLLALVALVAIQVPFAHAAKQVDLLLVLAVDVSRSVDYPKFVLQRDGYAAAVSDLQVLEAITSGRHARIAICFSDPPSITPTTGNSGCCARAASGHATAVPPSSVMNSRRFN